MPILEYNLLSSEKLNFCRLGVVVQKGLRVPFYYSTSRGHDLYYSTRAIIQIRWNMVETNGTVVLLCKFLN
jgi:hypothetical protein